MLSEGKMKTFGELPDTIAGTIIANFKFASQVHIAPDRYDVEDSITSGERSRRSQKTLNREDIHSSPTTRKQPDSGMFVHCEYIANQLSDINNSSKRIFPQTQM